MGSRTTRAPARLRLIAIALATVFAGCAAWAAVSNPLADASGESPLLPNLVAGPPDGAYFETSNGRLLLRFNGYILNKGPGALDIRGEREAPKVAKSTEEQVVWDREHEQEELTPEQAEELATPSMKVVQRLFTTSAEETNIERPHVNDQLVNAQLFYSSADGHDHWHLQHVARYALVSGSNAEVAPAQKVGFCLDDSASNKEGRGPASPVYSDNVPPYRDFCQRFHPETASLFEGISVGWHDTYSSNLAWQWVDVSSVQPGEYWLREEVNPEGVIDEEPEPNKPSYSSTSTVVPGYDAEPQSVETEYGKPTTVTLTARRWVSSTKGAPGVGGATYAIASGPAHGKVTLSGNHATYTPQAGFSGSDSFTFTAANSSSPGFPAAPATATVSIAVGAAPAPTVTIETAPTALTAGTSGMLTATSTGDTGAIEWLTSAGSIKGEGVRGEQATLTAPAAAGEAVVTARLADRPEISSVPVTVAITAAPASEPVPALPESNVPPASGGVADQHVTSAPPISRPRAMLYGHTLDMSATPGVAGRVRLEAWLGRHELGGCVGAASAGSIFSCRVRLARDISLHDRIKVVASLRRGARLFAVALGPERIPKMRMVPAGSSARSAAGSMWWCSPSTLIETLSRSGG